MQINDISIFGLFGWVRIFFVYKLYSETNDLYEPVLESFKKTAVTVWISQKDVSFNKLVNLLKPIYRFFTCLLYMIL